MYKNLIFLLIWTRIYCLLSYILSLTGIYVIKSVFNCLKLIHKYFQILSIDIEP